ncbi:MAG: BREX system P-loop protein BrxC [Acaryochloridaceae cyanobacterium RL_2_7]|nr:BREX system P-loop protein BrxC [Acaryochloridaceae cyanobacterium RL_2_7]
MLQANMGRAVQGEADVILFNIDSKADANSKNQKDSIVQVFQKVFDEHLGYFGAVPAIAEFERQLDQRGQYGAFKQAFAKSSGQESWENSRDAWLFHQEDIAQALVECAGMGLEAAQRLVESLDQTYNLSVEKFAQTVKQYVQSKGRNHRLLFMVDEVGQYVGENSDLMLNLQTVVEDLGVHCLGSAWVIVTSQEAMDEITKNKIRGNDFSKIVGRFYKSLSLSSANTDEVIKLRLLEKNEAAQTYLISLYRDKQAILKNQISFTSDCAEMSAYGDATDFACTYPFVSYQFKLLQWCLPKFG